MRKPRDTPLSAPSLADFAPDPRNANQGTERGRSMLEHSLRSTGAGRSIVVDKHGNVIAGNKTLEAWGEISDNVQVVHTNGQELVIVQRDDLDLQDPTGPARQLAYLDNRTGEVGLAWDAEAIARDVQAGVDLSTLWRADEIAHMLAALQAQTSPAIPVAEVDRAEELRTQYGVARGQLWQCGRHRLLCGDCTDRVAIQTVMQGQKAQLIFTDPPYNCASHGRNFAADAPTQQKTYAALKNARWDQHFDIQPIFSSLSEVIALDCAVYICTSHFLISEIWHWMQQWADFFSYIVWCKPNPAPSLAKRHWTWATELIPYAVRGKHICNFPREGHALNWWEIVSPSHTTDHPTEKPLAVPLRAISFSSNPGTIVFDGFVGSGSTLMACEQLNRSCYGIEIDPGYVAVTLDRWAQMTGKTPVLLEKTA